MTENSKTVNVKYWPMLILFNLALRVSFAKPHENVVLISVTSAAVPV
jgi:hypothetical protein